MSLLSDRKRALAAVVVNLIAFPLRAVGGAGCALIGATGLVAGPAAAGVPRSIPVDAPGEQRAQAARARILDEYNASSLRFEANLGQFDETVKFVARGHGYSLFLTPAGATLALHRQATRPHGSRPSLPHEQFLPPPVEETVIRMTIVGARAVAEPQGVDEQSGQTRYFIGNDPQRWQTGVGSYARVRYPEVLPGVDLVYYGSGQRELEYDLVVSPGADPRQVAIAFEGADRVEIDSGGGLVLHVGDVEILQRPPKAYQAGKGGERERIASRYVRRANGEIGFEVGRYDRSRPLVIDPVLVYSTYLGGTDADFGIGIAVDAALNAYVVGQTLSANYPTTVGAQQTVTAGNDAFVTKLSPNGSIIFFSTYFGGSGADYAWKVALDTAGNVYVVGNTESTNFPTTPGAFRTTYSGAGDTFVAKLTTFGTIVYSTYLGGSGAENSWGIAVDAAGSAYVAGDTASTNYPTTPGAFQATAASTPAAFVTKLAPNGAALAYSTYLGGPSNGAAAWTGGYDVAVDSSGSAYVVGYTDSPSFPTTPGAFQTTYGGGATDAFVTKLNPTGSALVYSTYLGGAGGEYARAIAVDTNGSAYVAGATNSTGFPTAGGALQTTNAGAVDSFVTKLNASGTGLEFSTYLGGSSDDNVQDIAVDPWGGASIVGSTVSTNFPTTGNALQATKSGGNDMFLSTLTATGALAFSSYLGGPPDDVAYGVASDSLGAVYVTGATPWTSYPTTPGAFSRTSRGDYDGVVTKVQVVAAVPATNVAAIAAIGLLLLLAGGSLARARQTARG